MEKSMAMIKSVICQVEEMYADGFPPVEIAEYTGLHFSEVIAILVEYGVEA
jgi:hypothetical protein